MNQKPIDKLYQIDIENITFRLFQKEDVRWLRYWGESADARFRHYTFHHNSVGELFFWYHNKQKFLTRKLYGLFAGEYPLGIITLKSINWFMHTAELGISIDPDYLSVGYGTLLLNKYLTYVYSKFPVNMLRLRVAQFNKRAKNAYIKSGFMPDEDHPPYLTPYESQVFREEIKALYPDDFVIKNGKLMTQFMVMTHTSDTITKKAYAKINLALDIYGTRKDGYHDLGMVMQTIDLHDMISVRPRKDYQIRVISDLEFPEKENLVYKAALLMMGRYHTTGYDISIYKRIPVAAGLGGASADAAAVINAIDEIHQLGLSIKQKQALALNIGADVPFCLEPGTAIAKGVGEDLTYFEHPLKMYYVLVTPDIEVPTKEVFQAYDQTVHKYDYQIDLERLQHNLQSGRITNVCKDMKNVLECVTSHWHQQVNQVKEQMIDYGALATTMSGSGPSIIGLFESEEQAKNAVEQFKKTTVRAWAVTNVDH